MKNQSGLEEQTTFLLAPPEDGIVQEVATRKRIALVAHDNKKNDLLEWARFNRDLLVQHELYATGTTAGFWVMSFKPRSCAYKAVHWAAISRSARALQRV